MTAPARTTVVNVYRDSFDVYAGRPRRGQAGSAYPYGALGNPVIDGHMCPVCGARHGKGESLPCFRKYFEQRVTYDPEFRNLVVACRGKRLACFCRPVAGFRGQLVCHAQIIAGWLDGVRPEDVP